MAAIDVAAANNDVLATSFGACALDFFAAAHAQLNRHGNAPDLNCTLPLAAEFAFRRGELRSNGAVCEVSAL